jgi:hypothetical protein
VHFRKLDISHNRFEIMGAKLAKIRHIAKCSRHTSLKDDAAGIQTCADERGFCTEF